MKKIKILGSGCRKCNELYNNTEQIARELTQQFGIEYQLEKVTDIASFASYGVMITPALVVDGQLKVAGKTPSQDDLRRFLRE